MNLRYRSKESLWYILAQGCGNCRLEILANTADVGLRLIFQGKHFPWWTTSLSGICSKSCDSNLSYSVEVLWQDLYFSTNLKCLIASIQRITFPWYICGLELSTWEPWQHRFIGSIRQDPPLWLTEIDWSICEKYVATAKHHHHEDLVRLDGVLFYERKQFSLWITHMGHRLTSSCRVLYYMNCNSITQSLMNASILQHCMQSPEVQCNHLNLSPWSVRI